MRLLVAGFSAVVIAAFAASAGAENIKLSCNVITPTDPFQECNSDNFTPKVAPGSKKKKIKIVRPLGHIGLSGIASSGRNFGKAGDGPSGGSTAGSLGSTAAGALSGASETLGGLLR